MDKIWYKISGTLGILAGTILLYLILYSILVYSWNYAPLFLIEILLTLLGFIFLMITFFFSGFYLIKLNPKKYNKLTNSAAILILISVLWTILVTLYDFFILRSIDLRGVITIIFGIIPAGIPYGISILLLIINWFKNK